VKSLLNDQSLCTFSCWNALLDFQTDMRNTIAMNILELINEQSKWNKPNEGPAEAGLKKGSGTPSNVRKIDLHTHSVASGHGTTDRVTDLAKEAAKRKMLLLGLSEHGPATVGSASLSYFRGLFLCEKNKFGVELRYGVEANILDKDGNLDVPDDILAQLDYCIVSMHRQNYTSGSAAENTRAYIRALHHPNVQIIGHCDDARFPVDHRELVKAAVSLGAVPELNNASLLPDSYRVGCRENDRVLLSVCESLSCPVILSSDSHGREHIGEMAEALKLIEEVQFPDKLILN
jgi:putative hydrolase